MLENIVETYLHENPPPNWLVNGMRELHWIFLANPRTAGYINTGVEIVETFVFDGEIEIDEEYLKEMNYSLLSNSKIKKVLSDARIIEIKESSIKPGPIIHKLQQKRWEGFESGSIIFENSIREMQAILSISILRSLLNESHYMPRSAYSVFTMLSSHVMEYYNDEIIPDRLREASWSSAFFFVPMRQQNKMIRRMIGLYNGDSKIINDYTENHEIELKLNVVNLLEQLRERYRFRERDQRER